MKVGLSPVVVLILKTLEFLESLKILLHSFWFLNVLEKTSTLRK